jgi:hypothetical protein
MEFTYPEELLLSGINQFLLYGRRNAFSYSAEVTLDDGVNTQFSNYIFPRNSHAGRYLGELLGPKEGHFSVDNMGSELTQIYSFLTEKFFSEYAGRLSGIDEDRTFAAPVSGLHLLYTEKTIVVFQLGYRALLDVSGDYMPLGGARLN